MNKYSDDEIVPRYRTKVSEPNLPDLRSEYEECVTDIRVTARHIVRYQGLFRKILEHLADTHGELMISCEKVYFVKRLFGACGYSCGYREWSSLFI